MILRAASLMLVLALLAACGGGRSGDGSSSDDDDGAGGAQETYAAETGAPAGAAQPTTAGEAQVAALQKQRKAATFKVVYEWSGSGSQPSNETWYHKGSLSRVDWGQPGDPSYTSHYVTKDGAFLCESSRAGESTCFKTASPAESPEELSFAATIMMAYEGILADPSFQSTRESRSIAGQSAACWKSGALLMLGLAEVTLCHHTTTGVPLLFQWKAGNDSFQMTAKSYSTTVADSDFDLPAKPVSY